MSNFEKQFFSNSKKEKNLTKEKKISRREFLQKMGKYFLIASAASATGLSIRDKEDISAYISDRISDFIKKNFTKNQEKEPIDETQEKNIEEDAKSIEELINFNNPEKIEFNLKTAEALKNHWKEKYKNNPNFKDSLEKAYLEMGGWEGYLKKEFSEENVPENFIYLAIPESHWNLKARSRAKAVGPYQFIPETAKKYGLNWGENFEERCDPIKSASACAKLLKDLYQSGGNDWNLALSGYNGGFYWHYLKEAIQKNQEINYVGFLNFLENKINEIKQKKYYEIENWERERTQGNYWTYEIANGDTLRGIAIKTGIDIDKICQINSLSGKNVLSIGQKIKIPIDKNKIEIEKKRIRKQKEREFYDEIRGFSENLNYPPKFNAVIELIQEKFVKEKKLEIKFRTIKTAPRKEDQLYTFKKQDGNLYKLLKKFPNLKLDDILEANPTLNPKRIQEGDKIIIPSQPAKITLEEIAKKYNLDPKHLITINPSILKPNENIPSDFEIRV